jgi:hypothetical protein
MARRVTTPPTAADQQNLDSGKTTRPGRGKRLAGLCAADNLAGQLSQP